MSLEQRILNVAEKQNYYDSRELRAIALEVRKREDRIKQLEEMYEGVIGERPEFLGSNVMGLLKRELTGTQKRIKELEEAGDALKAAGYFGGWADAVNKWTKAKEDKL